MIASPRRISEGQRLDVVDLLSSHDRDYLVRNNGDEVKVSSLKGKYVIICCFVVPIDENRIAHSCRAIKATFSEWNDRDDIEMVVIVDRASINIVEFEQFFSGFPSSCLAIPFWDSKFRHLVSKYLHFDKVDNNPAGVVIGPNNKVLQENTSCLESYGSNSFPFTHTRIRTIRKEVKAITRRRPVLLERLLDLHTDDVLVSNAATACDHVLPVSVFKTKLVGLYLCYSGFLMDRLIQLYQRCIELGRELEIILVFIDDIDNFVEKIICAVQEKGISSWWVLPYKETVSRRLWQLCKWIPADRLISVGPNGKFLDPKAVSIISLLGIEASYPFAIKSIVEQETSRLKALTLESVLVHSRSEEQYKYILTRDGVPVPIATLKGKYVLLCLAFTDNFFVEDGFFDMVLKWYNKDRIRNSKTQLELVFVPFDTPMPILPCRSRKRRRRSHQNSWLMCTLDHDHQAFMIEQLFVKGTYTDNTFIAFGEDGRILTTNGFNLISNDINRISSASIPFSDTLLQDVAAEYAKFLC